MEKLPITHRGYESLEKELKQLKSVDRPAIIEAIAEARSHGDLKENAEYHAAREKQSFIEGRIAKLEDTMARAVVVNTTELSGVRVMFGARVQLIDEESEEEVIYQIVSEYEADLDNGLISHLSPIARALISKEQGDSVEVAAPSGNRYYEILEVVYE